MSLPSAWIDKIFEKCSLVYGQDFLRRWAGLDLNSVKADWGRELTYYQAEPNSIGYALENLPVDRPPSVLQFRELCRHAPVKTLSLPAPEMDRVAAAQAVQRLGGIKIGCSDPKAWAHSLKQRQESGEQLSDFQTACWKEALQDKTLGLS